MIIVQRDPQCGYIDTWLWVPKQYANVEGTKNALSFAFTDSYQNNKTRYVYLWKETEHHLLVPRAFWSVGTLPFRVIDLRPATYKRTEVTSNIKLDHRWKDSSGSKALMPTGEDVQARSIEALLGAYGGTLQLACVSGDTLLNLNRGGKGFKIRIQDAYRRSTGQGRNTWKPEIPTYIRSHIGERIGLQKVIAFIPRGERLTVELELEDDKKLRLTPDHEVLTPFGYRQAQALKSGDEVIIDGNREGSVLKKRVSYKRIGGFRYHPHARYQSRSFCIEEHRALVEADINGLTLQKFKEYCSVGAVAHLQFIDPAKFHVHHKDENIHNNCLENLEVLTKDDHLSRHRPGASAFGYGIPVLAKIRHIHREMQETVYDVACEAPHNNFVANGIVVHNCGKGKTAVALELIARLRVPALVVVPDTQLFQQWKTEIEALLNIPEGIGVIQGPKFEWQKPVVLTTYHTIGARAEELPEEVRRWFGLIVWDEGHHVPAPTFAASAEAFFGYRLSLSATPERTDGLHIINEYHIGSVIYKDLRQSIKPNIYFRWTGLEIDETKPEARVRDKNGELHLSLVANYFARWSDRQQMIIEDIVEATRHGRKVLVVSTGEADLANLAALWTFGPGAPLYSDIPIPTPADFGEILQPLELTKAQRIKAEKKLEQLTAALDKDPSNQKLALHVAEAEKIIRQNDLNDKIEAELNRRQHQYIKWLQPQLTNCGLMIYKVKPEIRQHYIDTMPVVFAIMKYGKEGLDAEDLDTVLVSTAFSNRNGLQQLMGRTLRQHDKKKAPTVIFYEDNIGPMIGMCKKLRTALREWPIDEGGPFDYEQIGHPNSRKGTWESNKTRIFGQ